MTFDALIDTLKKALAAEKPFVAFCYPGDPLLLTFLQDIPERIPAEGWEGSGFVFAPFSGDASKVVIPIDHQYTAEIPNERDRIAYVSAVTDEVAKVSAKDQHITLVEKALEQLTAGGLQKVVLSRKISIPRGEDDVFNIFTRLLHAYPDAFRYLWYHPEVGMWMGATPETLLRVKGRELATMSLAGTQPYQGTLDVEWGAKEAEEQAMVTRSILKSIAPYTASTTAEATRTVKAGKLLHLLTPIKATLPEGTIQLDRIIEVLHPTPAVCGLPKEKAREFILDHEGYDRRYYTGYLGPVGLGDETRLFVNLRCMEITQDHYHIYVGGGITADSNPEAEWEETVNKSKTMKAVL